MGGLAGPRGRLNGIETTMIIGSGDEYVELTLLERVQNSSAGAGDIRVRATIKIGEFAGSYPQVWLGQEALAEFILQLQVLVNLRKGTARVSSMSPDEFIAEFKPTDSVGHYKLEVQLSRLQYGNARYRPITLAGSFEFEPTQFPAILAGFMELQNGQPIPDQGSS